MKRDLAASVVRTVEQTACLQHPAPWEMTNPPDPWSPYEWQCPLPVGSLNPTSSVLSVYFDWDQHAAVSKARSTNSRTSPPQCTW